MRKRPQVAPRVRRVLMARGFRSASAGADPFRSGWQAAATLMLALMGVLAAVTGLQASRAYRDLTRDLPGPQGLLRWLDPAEGLFALPTRLEDRYGHTLWGEILPPPARQARYVPWRDLGTPAREALEAVLDPAFWPQEPATDPALDLAREFLLAREQPGPRRERRARLLAREMEQAYPRERLLEWWANTRAFGPGLYGVDAASRAYFGRSVQELTWPQAIWLAVAARWPQAAAQPEDDAARERYQALVRFLFRHGAFPQAVLVEALAPPPVQPLPSLHEDPWTAWWMHAWLAVGSPPLPARGRVVRTTVEAPLQRDVACLVAHAYGHTTDPACPALSPWPLDPIPQDVSVEAVVLDPSTGEILALTFPERQKGPAPRPLGTGLAPWLYAAAFARGWSPATLLWDLPASLGPRHQGLTNHDGAFHGPVQAGPALANAYEVPLALLVERFGPRSLAPTLEALGMPLSPRTLQEGERLSGPLLTLPRAAHALGLFARLGTWAGWETPEGRLEPVLFTGARTLDGREEPLPTRARQPRLSPGVAYLVTYALSHPGWRRGPLADLDNERPLAVYMARAEGGRVLWVLGYSPQRVVGLVLDARGAAASSEKLALQARTLWEQVSERAHRGLPVEDWEIPREVVRVAVCVPSGMLPSRFCPTVEEMPFLPGSRPTQVDTYYRAFFVNTRTGHLATVFTPPEWVEERVYFVYPPEARAWAREQGRPLPPDEYDPVRLPPAPEGARITAPAPFAYVGGRVRLQGTAAGPRFRNYRVQVGRGLYPRRWRIVAEGDRPISEGLLAEWDTQNLPSGLYTVQLQVVDASGRLYAHTLQVTVDNRPPDVEVLAPAPGETVTPFEAGVLFQVQARDDYHLAWVRFLVDGREVMRFREGPFRWISPLPSGEHVLQVIAQDGAGNETRVQVPFTVPERDG